ncbi:MAG: T9SS type A sorting domain-containing protein [Candidatus Marinimicrobia bacterium]|nr:T9SS type A sorting domain-containing protein [Candidatus Neomarinimicrobiota bacterium]
MKKMLVVIAVLLTATMAFAGWDSGTVFPPDSVESYGHGVAVDGNGRIWYGSYYKTDSIYVAAADSFRACQRLLVFNPDGTVEKIIKTFGPFDPEESYFGYEIDTFWYALRGLGTTPDGDVIVSMYDAFYVLDKDDYTAKLLVKEPFGPGSSITKVATDAVGNFFLNMVVAGGQPIKAYDPDGFEIDAVVPGELISGYSRTIEVSEDAKDIYFITYTTVGIVIFHSDEGLDGIYAPADTIHGLNCESAAWSPDGLIWFGVHPTSSVPFTPCSHVAWDPVEKAFVDSMVPDSAQTLNWTILPRGIDFADENTAYVTYFNTWDNNGIYKFVKSPDGVWETEGIFGPKSFTLKANYPNPFNPTTTIHFNLTQGANVNLSIYDINGKLVETLVDEYRQAGDYTSTWNGAHAASGTYLYRLTVDGQTITRKMTLLK